nr:immunoglobulin heavy chain junction region [Mus musculus]NSM04083.1 immunoglobulin heavy chain junction region [Mus musculus]NSM05640.1 immunoglobulin heavy chain junction region [Mus musculus]NSM06501.1 immunoglobulin heavy chain junction region [Mus musculus]NSM06930.1 immunoglobulin heavy chain junction region [Mus musculus]
CANIVTNWYFDVW